MVKIMIWWLNYKVKILGLFCYQFLTVIRYQCYKMTCQNFYTQHLKNSNYKNHQKTYYNKYNYLNSKTKNVKISLVIYKLNVICNKTKLTLTNNKLRRWSKQQIWKIKCYKKFKNNLKEQQTKHNKEHFKEKQQLYNNNQPKFNHYLYKWVNINNRQMWTSKYSSYTKKNLYNQLKNKNKWNSQANRS